MARLISVQGPSQLLAVLCVLFHQQQYESNIDQEDILIIGGLHADDLTSALLNEITHEIAKTWNFCKIIDFDDAKQSQKAAGNLLKIIKDTTELIGLEHVTSIYVCRTWGNFNEIILSAYPEARIICYGDGYGLLDNNDEFWVPQNHRLIRSLMIDAYVTIPIDYFESASLCRNITQVSSEVFEKTLKLVIHQVLQYVQQSLASSLMGEGLNTSLQENLQISLVLTANHTESGATPNLEAELEFYAETCLKYTSRYETLLIKGHPRETQQQSSLLAQKLRLLGRSAYVLNGCAHIPVELLFPFLNAQKVLAISPSSSAPLAFLYQDFDLVLGADKTVVEKYLSPTIQRRTKANDLLYIDIAKQAVNRNFNWVQFENYLDQTVPNSAFFCHVSQDSIQEQDSLCIYKEALSYPQNPQSYEPISKSARQIGREHTVIKIKTLVDVLTNCDVDINESSTSIAKNQQMVSHQPLYDYVSPNLKKINIDKCFPYLVIGDTIPISWPYLRKEVPHNWYVDQRVPTVGFLSRDEAHILYNLALQFRGQPALEIGCWMGWSACHLALAGVQLDVVDPLLNEPGVHQTVLDSLTSAGVRDRVNLVPGYSPQAVQELAAQRQQPWSLIFIDGNHERPGPLEDAMVCAQLAAPDAAIVFHDLASPDVAEGLDYLRQQGWNTMVYQTMQIMGVAWRGNVEPIQHQPDPQVNWTLPPHLQDYSISGMVNFPSQVTPSEPGIMDPQTAIPQIQALMQQSANFYNNNQPVEALRAVEQAASLRIFIPELYYLRAVCLVKVGRCEEALAAAREELRLNPGHAQVRAFIDNLAQAIARPESSVIPTSQRPWNTSLNRETLMSIQNASHNYAYRGVPMIKNPFDFALYPMLLWNVKPRTIIEIGSKEGGSGLWLGDLINNFDLDCHIYSLDIVRVDSVSHPRVTFMEANGRLLGETLSAEFINSLPRPLLVIEDADHAYETSIGVLEFFHPHLQLGEYIVIEDGIISDIAQDPSYNSGPHRALKEFLGRYPDHYEMDSNYCDFFGYNLTWCTNGFLRKVR